MTLTILDFILIIILFFFAFGGFFFGLIHAVGAIVGTIAGIIVASNYFQVLSDWIGSPFGLADNWVRIISFLLIFVVVNRLVGFVFYLIDKIFKLGIIPFVKTINRLGGLIFGLAEGVVILGVVLVFVIKFPFAGFLIPAIEASELAKFLFGVGAWLTPLLPELFQEVRSMLS